MLRLALCLLFATATTLAKAVELETTHLFGFTLGSDVNAVGEKEAESETVGRFGKTAGTYGVLSEALGIKFIPLQNFSVEPIISGAGFDVSGVPGAPHWQLAPVSMSWQGLSPGELCAVLKNPQMNGNRSLADLVKHMDEDKLVLWGWNPGKDVDGKSREPVPIPHAEFVSLLKEWAALGGACP